MEGLRAQGGGMIWRVYIYTMVMVLAAATLGSFVYLVVAPPARLARTSYGLNRFTTPSVVIPKGSNSHSATSRSMTVGELIRYYQASAGGGGGAPATPSAIAAPTGC